MKVVLAGGTGFIGKKLLQELLRDGHEITLLTRHPEIKMTRRDQVDIREWDGLNAGGWVEKMDGADAVINLAGEPIAARWTDRREKKIVNSRVLGTRLLVTTMQKVNHKPKILINASGVGFYGNVPDGEVVETHPKGKGFLADTCERWEAEALRARPQARVVLLRTGIVLGNGGALAKMLLPFRLFMGGPVGSGKQWFPWIHLDDEVAAILFALKNDKIEGPINLTSPQPMRMDEFCDVLGQVLGRPSWTRVPGWVLWIALGDMSQLLLTGQKAMPGKLRQAGFSFRYSSLREALQSILK